MLKLDQILNVAIKQGASDVHLKTGVFPVIRKHGKLYPLAPSLPPLTHKDIASMANELLDDEQKKNYARNKDIDIGHGISGLGRFRINIFQQRGTMRMVIRNIPHKIPQLSELSLPPVMEKIADMERGLILVTGATGSGKSSTLAAIIDHINRNKSKHILMIEDPVEYLIKDRKSLITQRELNVDAINFSSSLRAALRQDPDIILIGEMRDRETIEIALLAAETGHLVLSTLHTTDTQETINRILAAFPPEEQSQKRFQLASVLKAVVGQRLVRGIENSGFFPAVEVLINNSRIKEMIEDPKRTVEIQNAVEEGRESYGMQSFDQSLRDLISQKKVTFEEAIKHSSSPDNFSIQQAGVESGSHWSSQSTIKGGVTPLKPPPPEGEDSWAESIELEAVPKKKSS